MKAGFLTAIILFVIFSCKRDTGDCPIVITSPISEVTWEYAISGGEVIDDGGSPVTARGVCATRYKFDPPAIDSEFETWFTNDSSGIGPYSSKIKIHWSGAALSIRDTHYLRAYAKNSTGVAYGEVLKFYPKSKPPDDNSIRLINITHTATSALVEYYIDNMPRYSVDERGICYNTGSNPTVDSPRVLITDSMTSYSSVSIENLEPNTIYFIRGYVKNESAIYYTDEMNFTTSFYPPAAK